MGRRLDLQAIFLEITPKVYFQPPADLQMTYPCIVYQRDLADTKFAGNQPYSYVQRYQVTLIDPNPDSDILPKIKDLPMCVYSRGFATSGLNHDVFTLYF
jgi:hypothetical protein